MNDRKTMILAKAFLEIEDGPFANWGGISDKEQERFYRMAQPFVELVEYAIMLEKAAREA